MQNKMTVGERFAELQMPQKSFVDPMLNTYRVYSTVTEFNRVTAQSASEAIKQAGIENPARVVREMNTLLKMIESAGLAKPEEAGAMAAPEEVTPVQSEASAEPPA